MASDVTLKLMRCPTCGADLKAKNASDPITCVYCGNTIVPVAETSGAPKNEGTAGLLKIEGIKTPSSALAYLEQFFEDYDWEAFTYAEALTVPEIDKLANSMISTSADDKNAWFVAFKAISQPLMHKVENCKEILASVIAEYKKDNLDAYSRYDAYKRIATLINHGKGEALKNLEKILTKAKKYGATEEELRELTGEMEAIRELPPVTIYRDPKQIPEIVAFDQEKNAKIARALAEKGIQAQESYDQGKLLMEEGKYVEALNIFLSLEGYCDSDILAAKIDRYFLIADVLEIEGTLYYFKNDGNYLNLHPTEGDKILPKPIIRNIGQIITNYANILYYLDDRGRMKRFDFATGTEQKFDKKNFDKSQIYVHGRKAYLLTNASGEEINPKRDLYQVDLATGTIKVFLSGVRRILSLRGSKLVYEYTEKENNKLRTAVLDVDTMQTLAFGTKPVSVVGYAENYVVYTQDTPNQYNRNLYVCALGADQPEMLIEANILRFCDVIGGKLFYYIGNFSNQTLVTANLDGTGRREWPRFISRVLLEQGGWVYFIRKAGYNAVLCKARLDGSKYSVIAADIEDFICIKNGYLYYINDESTLVKVRMDGSNLQTLCRDVEKVLSVREDKIVFVSLDDSVSDGGIQAMTKRAVKSIYAVDFSGGGKIKLAYDVKTAKECDDNTVYYIGAPDVRSSFEQPAKKQEVLCKLDVESYGIETLLTLEIRPEEKAGGAGAWFVVFLAFMMAVMGFTADMPELGFVGCTIGVVALCIALVRNANDQET